MSKAARPKYIGEPGSGPGDGLAGHMGVEGFDMLFIDRRPFKPPLDVKELCVRFKDVRRTGVMNDEERRERDETVRGRGLGLTTEVREAEDSGPVASSGLCTTEPVPLPFTLCRSSSAHCRCRIIDFVAHCKRDQSSVSYHK